MSTDFSQNSAFESKALFNEVKFDNILKCVHCGLCLDSCPTYRELSDEKDSPRGRLYLMRGLWEGELELIPQVIDPLNRCIDCRACESACPSGVPFGELLEKTRGIILENKSQSIKEKISRMFILNGLFRSTGLMISASFFLKLYIASGLPKLITKTFIGRFFPESFVFKQHLLPNCSGESFKRKHADKILSPLQDNDSKKNPDTQIQQKILRVGMFSGCIMDVSEKAIHDSTLNLLRSIGCEVVVPGNQVCCGALHVHSGDRKTAQEFAVKNLSAFEPRNLDAIITNAAGCGAQLMEYHHLFAEEISNAQMNWSSFENKIIDVLEFLSGYSELLEKLPFMDDDDTVLYDAPCHLIHAQKVDDNPRKLLSSLPGVKLVPLTESSWCCGSGGIYNLVQPDLSKAVLKRKIESVRQTLRSFPEAKTIVTGNPGCLYQIRAGLRSSDIDLEILHPIVYIMDRLKKNGSP